MTSHLLLSELYSLYMVMEVRATILLTYGGFPYLPPINVVNKFQPAKTDAKLEHIDYASDALGKVKNKL